MDEVLRHCMRELAFDGDLGCDVSRLRGFIEGFYTPPTSANRQTVDDAFHAFVWSLLIQQPSVRVGLAPQGDTVEVYIAPQLSKRKKVVKPKKKQRVPEPAPFPALDEQCATVDDEDPEPSLGRLQLIHDATPYTLNQLIQQHGDALRVAVDPETSFRAITGSHARPAKLSPMVYTALQFISRGREDGLSVVSLGKKTGYDQKTCFYLIKQLLSLDLVVKLGQGGPGGGNFCIHKYFYTRSAFWRGVRREEAVGEDQEDEDKQHEEPSRNDEPRTKLQFDPIDSRHLASTQLIKSRLVRLLKNSENGLHMYQNLLVTIGFVNPIRRDRRFFIVRIRELIKERVIEKVLVPRMDGSSTSLCIRLVEDHRSSDTDGIVVQPGDVGDEEQEVEASEDPNTDMPMMNQTIHRQILNLLEQSGGHGLTLYNISARLGMFDKRTLELLIYRLERDPPPPHLADLSTCDFIENQGRERRHRYYTLPGYHAFILKENIDHAERMDQYTSMDISQAGGFSLLADDQFYNDTEALVKYEDEYRNKFKPPKAGGTRKIGRPRKVVSKPHGSIAVPDEEAAAPLPKPRRTKPKAAQALAVNEKEGADAQQVAEEPTKQRGTKRKRKVDGEEGEESSQPVAKKKRARQTKMSVPVDDVPDVREVLEEPKPKRKRGQSKPVAPHAGSVVPQGASPASTNDLANRQASKTTSLNVRPAPTPTYVQDTMETSAFPSTHRPLIFATEDGASSGSKIIPGSSQNAAILAADTVSKTVSKTVSSTNLPGSTQLIGHQRLSSDTPLNLDPEGTLQPLTSGSLNPSKGRSNLKRARDLSVHATDNDEPVAKRPKPGRPKHIHSLVNISQLRAENEILRVVEASGGIVNVSSKEFFEAYSRVISMMTEAGEATSMPVGTQPDRRTISKITDRLAERGRVKTLTATLAPRVSQPRPVKLIYESGVTQEKLDQYLSALREGVPALAAPPHQILDQAVDYTRSQPKRRGLLLTSRGVSERGSAKENWHRSLDMMGSDEDAIQSRMLSELQTAAQLYGFLVGKARRARELHLFSLAHLQSTELSSHVVSQTERIIAFPYYYNDLPVSTYFTIVSATECSTELSTLMQTPEGRQTLVKDLPLDLHDSLKIGRARARDSMFSLFEILASLKLVTPLQPSKSSNPDLACEPNGSHPIHFDIVSLSKEKHTGTLPPQYWRFNTIAPVYFYGITTPWPPPFHRDVMIRTADESVPFWFELEDVSLSREYVDPMNSMDSITGACACTLEVARGLRRRSSWVFSYVLSFHQKQYLQRWTNPLNGYTPLSDPDGGRDCLEHLCRVISAPFDRVYDFFRTTHDVFQRETERIRERDRRRREEQRERQANKDRTMLARKAAAARHQLEADWEELVSRAHPAPLPWGSVTRLKDLKTRYMQSKAGMTTQKWETAVLEALSGPKSGKRNPVLPTLTSISRKPAFRGAKPNLPPIAVNPQRSVAELIDRYRDKVPAVQAMLQRKNKKISGSGDSGAEVAATAIVGLPRRQRFNWTPEYDELARDVSAIIRARCRTWHRMDWTALEQVFPFLPRNSARQRITTLRQEAGADAYLRLLEDKWHELWLEHRGTDTLPDENPTLPAKFDAIAHVEFLRKYIDKRALRVGLSNATVEDAAGTLLTETVPCFLSNWRINENARPSNKLDFMWTSIGEEHREKTLLGEAFSITQGSTHPSSSDPRSNGVAESALKMTLSTFEEDYDAKDATSLLNSTGQQAVRLASEQLLAQGVVSEVGGGHRKKPGRKLKISALNEDALGGSFHADFFSDACATEDMFEDATDDWTEWSMTVADGEIAALIDLVSESKIEFRVDISGPTAQRQQLDWNSKKVDDYQIETALAIRFHNAPDDLAEPSERSSDTPTSGSMNVDELNLMEHGQSFGAPAPCHKTSQGIITCSACVDNNQTDFFAQLTPESRRVGSEIIQRLDKAGSNGLSYEQLAATLSLSSDVQRVIDDMTSRKDPLCYWAGYTDAVLVSRRHIGQWSVSILGPAPRLILPRRWLNIKGERMENIWGAGLRAVVGLLVVRPGTPQAELRRRLLSVYDRQELNDMLHYLWVEGLIAKRCISNEQDLASRSIRALSHTEEKEVCWTLKANAWYRVNE